MFKGFHINIAQIAQQQSIHKIKKKAKGHITH